MHIGIVGNEGAKFSALGEQVARGIIRDLLIRSDSVLVSGHCPLGGIDIWAEEEAQKLGREMLIFPPKENNWAKGYKPRNIQIAKHSDIVHNIVVDRLPAGFRGRRHSECYHCDSTTHVKSGGCWTAIYAQGLGKEAVWHTILNNV